MGLTLPGRSARFDGDRKLLSASSGGGLRLTSYTLECIIMLSQQDMEDFMEIEAAQAEQDEVAAKLEQPSSADRSTIKEHQAPDPLSIHRDDLTEAVRSLLSAGHQVSELLAQVAKRSRN
jgi:hypothetical protein